MVDSFLKTDFRDEVYKEYARTLGEVVLAWNNLHEALGVIFSSATGIPNRLLSDAMWYSCGTDRAQREMLKAMLEKDVIGHFICAPVRSEVIWILKQVDRIEDKRNDLIHAPVYYLSDGLASRFAWGHGHKRAKKLYKTNPIEECKWLYSSIEILRNYAFHLFSQNNNCEDAQYKRPIMPNRSRK